MAYLDTTIVRQLGRRVCALPKGEHRTSLLTCTELLAGLARSERDFRVRRATLRSLLASDVEIERVMPESKLVGAFRHIVSRYNEIEPRTEPLMALVEAARCAESIEAFLSAAKLLDTPYTFDFFVEVDRAAGENFIADTQKGHADLEAALQSELERGRTGWGATSREVLEKISRIPELNLGLTRYALARAASMHLPQPVSEDEQRAIFESYDDSLEPYVAAMA